MSICGLDFGTSNTTLGTVAGREPVLTALEGDQTTIPSAIFYQAGAAGLIGRRAIEAYVAEWQERYGVRVDIQTFGRDNSLPPDVAAVLYRLVQEGLTNVLKHAKASKVSIVLEKKPEGLALVLEDDGIGFDPDKVSRVGAGAGLGLSGMKERVALLGGTKGITRLKGVFHLPDEWEVVNRAGTAVSVAPTAYRRDSRLEVFSDVLDWAEFERALVACVTRNPA